MTVSIATLTAMYVSIPLACLMGIWMLDEWRVRHRHYIPATRIKISCETCLHQFMADKDELLPKCPQCGSRNKRPDIV